ncbi:hypothetical protein [Cerasicoccus frondis]|uniref:hypothetical protein n=1 Tax=Cerasicoccus frondis TaxID=490090 RepID=UPI002852D848|nr:hypothetical protein [Cerasicoccus frondis]
MRILLTFLGLAMFVVAEGRAQDAELLNTEFRCISWQRPIQEELYVKSGGEYIPLKIHNMKRSGEVDYVGANPVVFYRKAKGQDGETIYMPAAQVGVSPGVEQPLFFFIQNGANYRIACIEDSFSKYPVGSYRFYNLTSKNLKARMGDIVLTLNSQQTSVLPQPFTDNVEYPVAFVINSPEGVEPLYTNKWQHSEHHRYLIMVADSPYSHASPIDFRVITDYPLP